MRVNVKYVPSIILLIASIFSSHAATPALGFKGLIPDTEAAGIERPAWVCEDKLQRGTRVCSRAMKVGDETIAGAVAKYVGVQIDQKNRLLAVKVYFSVDDFEKVLAALKSKYGNPSKIEKGEVQNKFGKKFVSTQLLWKSGNASMIMKLYDGTLENSSVRWSGQLDEEWNKGAVESAKKDL